MRTFNWFQFTSHVYARTLEATALLESNYEWIICLLEDFMANLENSLTRTIFLVRVLCF